MIIVDTNERGIILSVLHKYVGEYRRENIDVDITDDKRSFVIERKTVTDFRQSVLKDHLKKQCEYMVKTYPDIPKYIILEGTLDDVLSVSPKGEGLIKATFYRIPHVYGIPILETVDAIGTAKAVRDIAMYAPGAMRLLEHSALELPPKTADPRVRTLMTIPGIGRKNAERLLEEYGSLMNVFTSDISELKGIGKKMNDVMHNYLEGGGR